MTRDFVTSLYGAAETLGRQGTKPQGIDGGDARSDGPEIFELRDLRTLPAVHVSRAFTKLPGSTIP